MALDEDDMKKKKRWKDVSQQLISILKAPCKKKDLRTGLEKKMRHLQFLEHPLQKTHGAFLTFTARYKQLPGYSLP